MNVEEKRETSEFYLGRVDEVFAEMFLLFGGAFRARMEILPAASDVREVFSPRTGDAGFGEAVDFELSSCECGGLEDADPKEYIGTSVRTSSALEFFDRVFRRNRKVVCDVDFVDASWMIAVAARAADSRF